MCALNGLVGMLREIWHAMQEVLGAVVFVWGAKNGLVKCIYMRACV